MIPLQDLRVGNWATHSKISSRSPSDKPFQIGVEDFMYHQLIDPIPITEDWLKRFGFEISERVARLLIAYGDSNSPCSLVFIDKTIEICRSGIFAIEAPCQYVHQLQNLYYALTGTELELKS